jgi:hypothetical protein
MVERAPGFVFDQPQHMPAPHSQLLGTPVASTHPTVVMFTQSNMMYYLWLDLMGVPCGQMVNKKVYQTQEEEFLRVTGGG